MTRKQIEEFKRYVQITDPEFFSIMDTVCVFAVVREEKDFYYLLENAFQQVLPTKANTEKYCNLLAEFKKVNRIYNPVPGIADDFAEFLMNKHYRLFCKLNGDFHVIVENGEHTAVLPEGNGERLTTVESQEFYNAWIQFKDSLTTVSGRPF